MKRSTLTLPVIFIALFSSVTFASSLPEVIDNKLATSQVKIGSVSVSGVRGRSEDAVKELQQEAENLGDSKLHIVAMNTPTPVCGWGMPWFTVNR